jgi:hypothetical protein
MANHSSLDGSIINAVPPDAGQDRTDLFLLGTEMKTASTIMKNRVQIPLSLSEKARTPA